MEPSDHAAPNRDAGEAEVVPDWMSRTLGRFSVCHASSLRLVKQDRKRAARPRAYSPPVDVVLSPPVVPLELLPELAVEVEFGDVSLLLSLPP